MDKPDLVLLSRKSGVQLPDSNNSRSKSVRVIVSSQLTDRDKKEIIEFIEAYDIVEICIGHNSGVTDITFVEQINNLYSFDLYDYDFSEYWQLSYIPETIKKLTIGSTRSKKLSLEFINRFTNLESLFIEGHKKDFEKIGGLNKLKSMVIRSVTLPSLQPIKEISCDIEELDIKLGGTSNLDLLPDFKKLKYLELWKINGLEDISPISEVVSLQYLFLQAIRNVTALPDLSKLKKLRRVVLETMKGIRDLSAFRSAPVLEELALVDMKQLQPEDFQPIVCHPTLKALRAGLGSTKKNNAVKEMIDLPCEFSPFEYS